ncbi:hypothetical protein Sjap_026064 [Stephania japonica]|uniref:Thioredoxin domain-containing protein n=1 Tax=Stephania japonica TaxID=461633 RepID=A0AAP0E5Z7_9MAGN
MSHPEMRVEALTDRFNHALGCDKPDFRELDLGSPVSPLRRARNGAATSAPGGAAPASTSSSSSSNRSSSSSSGSVTGKTGAMSSNTLSKRSDIVGGGEVCGSTEAESTRSPAPPPRNFRPGHARSKSAGAPLIFSSSSGVNSPIHNALPTGNICPSGKIVKTGMAQKSVSRSDVLGSGLGNYGHGSIMRGGGSSSSSSSSSDSEELKRAGNELYKRGHFAEALLLYDRAIALVPDNAAYRSNRAAALTGLRRFGLAVRECEEAVRLDPGYGRAHQRLAALHLRLGRVESARNHLFLQGQQPDPTELHKLVTVERHLNRCTEARKSVDWKSALREGDAAIAAGADASPQLFACRAEALLKLHQLEEADSALAKIPKFEPLPPSCLRTKIFGMLSEAYPFFVRAQIEMALGRFENAVTAAEKAGLTDPRNVEVATLLNCVRLVTRARSHGNELFNAGKFAEACVAYGEGLKFDQSNPVLYCNRAACWSKLGQWERSIEDCNQALRIQPNYTKALLRRAASNEKLERWVESVRDYEILRKELPGDNEVAEALFHAQVALKKSRGEEVYNLKFGGEVEEVSGLDQLRAAVSSPGVSVILFKTASNLQCNQICPFMDTLCMRYPSVNFLKVDVEESKDVAKTENVRIVPTFKIYKNGSRVKEMICPSQQVLEYSLRHYSL